MKAQRGSRVTALLFLQTRFLIGGGLLTPRTGRFTPEEETRYPWYRRLGWLQGQSERVPKISTPPGLDPGIVQPNASCYAYCVGPPHNHDEGDEAKEHEKNGNVVSMWENGNGACE
jgi:hypothetical protein